MLANLKALVVVLLGAALIFRLAAPTLYRFSAPEAFARRRFIWFGVTTAAFLSPNFWLWLALVAPLLVWGVRRDANPLALFCMLIFAVPPVSIQIPALVVNQLFDLTPLRVLSILILIPVAARTAGRAAKGASYLDAVLVGSLLLQVVLLVPYESFTNTMRRSVLLALDVWLIYHCFSRVDSDEARDEVVANLWLASAIMAPIAVFESLKGWLLYTGVADQWGSPNVFAWLMRGESLRALASTGHSIGLGYQMAMALGLLLVLKRRDDALLKSEWIISAFITCALYVSYSRGAWLTGALVLVTYGLLRPKSIGRVLRGVTGLVALAVVVYATPLRESIISRLPFIGTADQDTVEYRQELARVSWELVKQNPWFGDPFVLLNMESLRQGQGIIDIVNGYLGTALFTGFVGLAMFVVVLVGPGFMALRRFHGAHDGDHAKLEGAAWLGCLAGTMLFISTAGQGFFTYLLCGLLVSFARLSGDARWPSRAATVHA